MDLSRALLPGFVEGLSGADGAAAFLPVFAIALIISRLLVFLRTFRVGGEVVSVSLLGDYEKRVLRG